MRKNVSEGFSPTPRTAMKIMIPAAAVAYTVNHPVISIVIPTVLPIFLPVLLPLATLVNSNISDCASDCASSCSFVELDVGNCALHLWLFLYFSWIETVFGTVPVSDRFDFLSAVTRRCRDTRAGYRTGVDGSESKAKWKPFAPPLHCASWARLRKDEREIRRHSPPALFFSVSD